MRVDRDKLELWLWARGVVGAHQALTDAELIAGIGGKDPARRAEVQECLRAGAKGGKRATFSGLFWRGVPASGAAFQRVWGIPNVGEPPPGIASILHKREAQRARNALQDREARNARRRELYAENEQRREKVKQRVYKWRENNARLD